MRKAPNNKTQPKITTPSQTNKALPEHILLKLRSENGHTITDHAAMITSKGIAILGKMGQRVSLNFLHQLNRQVEAGIATFLFLTIREGWNGPYVTYRCRLRSASETLESSKRTFVPPYYLSDAARIHAWFEIATIEKLTREEMNQIFVLSSNREIMSVVNSSCTIYRVGLRQTH